MKKPTPLEAEILAFVNAGHRCHEWLIQAFAAKQRKVRVTDVYNAVDRLTDRGLLVRDRYYMLDAKPVKQ